MLPVHEKRPGMAGIQKPTRVRYWVVFFAVTLAVVTYVDRVAISFAAPFMSRDLGLDSRQMGTVFAAFGWAYALFEIPGGYLGDRLGPRSVLTRIVLWWSFFTAATGWAWSFLSLCVTRFLFGAGEAGCFPNITKAFTTWLPKRRAGARARRAVAGARWGGAFTPLLVAVIMKWMGWRHSFEIFGLLGVAWAIAFFSLVSQQSAGQPQTERGRARDRAPRVGQRGFGTAMCRGRSSSPRARCG